MPPSHPPPDAPAAPAPGSAADPARAVLGALAAHLAGEHHLGHLAHHLAAQTLSLVPGASEASVTLARAGVIRTAAFTGPRIAALDERPQSLGPGPALAAARTGAVVDLRQARVRTAYPAHAQAAARHHLAAVVHIALPAAEASIGALSVATTGALAPAALAAATAYAHHAAIALAIAWREDAAHAESEQLRTALASREIIDMAKGVIIARHHVRPEQAFAQLAATSQHANRKLRQIATDIVAAAQHPHHASAPGARAPGARSARPWPSFRPPPTTQQPAPPPEPHDLPPQV